MSEPTRFKNPVTTVGFALQSVALGLFLSFTAASQAQTVLSGAEFKELSAPYGCYGCHADTEKLVGPAFNAVASKYAGQADAVETLSNSISKGSSGRWGGRIGMAANSTVKPDELKKMVDYILSLK